MTITYIIFDPRHVEIYIVQDSVTVAKSSISHHSATSSPKYLFSQFTRQYKDTTSQQVI